MATTTPPRPDTSWSPVSPWSDINQPWPEIVQPDPDGSTAIVRGVTGSPVVVTGLDREAPIVVTRTLTWAQAVRLRLVFAWAGLALLGLASVSVFAAVAWGAPAAAVLAAGFGLSGSFSLITGELS